MSWVVVRAHFALLLVAFIWGLTFPLIRQSVAAMDAYQFVFVRFSIATLLFAMLLIVRRKSRPANWGQVVLWGLGLGGISGLSYITQTIGLETVSSGRAAFITGTNILMVPFLAPLLHLGRPSRLDLLAACIALLGLALITHPHGSTLQWGDLWVLACAFFYALYIVLLQRGFSYLQGNVMWFAFCQVFGVWMMTVMCLPFSSGQTVAWSPLVTVSLLFCASFATIGTFVLQSRFQRDTTAQATVLIFALEPVFAAVFGYILLQETMTGVGAFGAFIILSAIIGVEWCKQRRRNT